MVLRPDDEADENALPAVEIVSEAADGRTFQWTEDTEPAGESVTVEETFGDTRITRIVAAAENAIDRNRYEVVAGAPGGHGSGLDNWLAERSSQVIQATPLPLDRVVTRLHDLVGERRRGLTITAHEETREREATFRARLRIPGLGRRRVTVRVYPTPSANLTVLEMLPLRRWMPQTKRYLRAGVPAMTALISEVATPSAEG